MPDITDIQDTVRALSPTDRSTVVQDAVKQMSPDEKKSLSGLLGGPTQTVTNTIWLRVVTAFVIVLVGAFLAMAVFLFMAKPADTLLTVFTTVAAFLGGLLAPSPVAGK